MRRLNLYPTKDMGIVQTIIYMIKINVGAEMKGGKIEIVNGGPPSELESWGERSICVSP